MEAEGGAHSAAMSFGPAAFPDFFPSTPFDFSANAGSEISTANDAVASILICFDMTISFLIVPD
jgi:hypothetical protein